MYRVHKIKNMRMGIQNKKIYVWGIQKYKTNVWSTQKYKINVYKKYKTNVWGTQKYKINVRGTQKKYMHGVNKIKNICIYVQKYKINLLDTHNLAQFSLCLFRDKEVHTRISHQKNKNNVTTDVFLNTYFLLIYFSLK